MMRNLFLEGMYFRKCLRLFFRLEINNKMEFKKGMKSIRVGKYIDK